MNVRAVSESLRSIERNLGEDRPGEMGTTGRQLENQKKNAIAQANRVVKVAERYLKTLQNDDGYTAKIVMHDLLDAIHQASDFPGVDESGKLWDVLYDALRAARE